MLVEMKAYRQSSGGFLRLQPRGVIAAELIAEGPLRSYLLLNFRDMVKIVRQRGMNVSEGDRGEVTGNFVGSHALILMPHHYIKHAHTVTCNARPATADSGGLDDPVSGGVVHDYEYSRGVNAYRTGVPGL